MEKIDFDDIYVEDVLREIKEVVEKKINLEDKLTLNKCNSRLEKTDNAMREVLKGILTNTKKDRGDFNYSYLMLRDGDDGSAKKKLRLCLILYYTALYFDNVKLLQRLMREGVNFGENATDLPLGIFDPELISYFEEEEYFELAKSSGKVIDFFYKTIDDCPNTNKGEYFEMFSKIMKKHRNSWGGINAWAFSKSCLDSYGEDIYLNCSLSQINEVISANFKTKHLDRIKNLLKTTDFDYCYGAFVDKVFDIFSDDELLSLNREESYFIYCASFDGRVEIERLKNLILARRSLVNYPVVRLERFLEMFSDDEILGMDDETLAELNKNRNKFSEYITGNIKFKKADYVKTKIKIMKNKHKNKLLLTSKGVE